MRRTRHREAPLTRAERRPPYFTPSQNLRMWLYLEVECLQIKLVKTRSSWNRVTDVHIEGYLKTETLTHTGKEST